MRLKEQYQRMTAKYSFGFFAGHEYLSQADIMELRNILETDNGELAISEYERAMAARIGDGQGKSFLSARMAFYTLMKVLGIGPGDEVLLTGWTCAVMPNAVWRLGATPVFADIEAATLGTSVDDVERKITPRTKMLVIQHSFGIPCNVDRLRELTQKKGIFLLEDAAISLGSKRDGIAVGNWGDAALFSTDHTKPLNTVIGGFFYTRNRDLFQRIETEWAKLPELGKDHQKRLFDQMLFEKKYSSPDIYGRAGLHRVLRRTWGQFIKQGSVFLEADYAQAVNASADYPYPCRMPAFLAKLGSFELKRWGITLEHRQKLLANYIQLMERYGLKTMIPAAYLDRRNEIVPLRFAFLFPSTEQMKEFMSSFLDLKQIWFQSPVICCPDSLESIGYQQGSCPVAEKSAQMIINWPCVVSEKFREQLLFLFSETLRSMDGHKKKAI